MQPGTAGVQARGPLVATLTTLGPMPAVTTAVLVSQDLPLVTLLSTWALDRGTAVRLDGPERLWLGEVVGYRNCAEGYLLIVRIEHSLSDLSRLAAILAEKSWPSRAGKEEQPQADAGLK